MCPRFSMNLAGKLPISMVGDLSTSQWDRLSLMLPLEPFSWTIFSHEIRAGWKVWRFWVASFLSVRLIWGEVYLSRSQDNSLCVDDGACRCSRPIDNRLVRTSPHQWVTDSKLFTNLGGAFIYESKLHLCNRAVNDIHHSRLFDRSRPLHPQPVGQLLGGSIDPDVARKMKGIADSARRRSTEC